jgi:hypothetical protein
MTLDTLERIPGAGTKREGAVSPAEKEQTGALFLPHLCCFLPRSEKGEACASNAMARQSTERG